MLFKYDFATDLILQFIGDYKDLQKLRLVNKEFKKNIKRKHINKLTVTKKK